MDKFKKRCEDCANLITKGKEWVCAECFNQPIAEIDDCPEGLTFEEVAEMVDKKVKVDHGAENKRKKTEKPKTVKVSEEKQEFFKEIVKFLENSDKNFEIIKQNKLISIKMPSGKEFKLDLVETRQKKE